mgnify:CR=1 FL=1
MATSQGKLTVRLDSERHKLSDKEEEKKARILDATALDTYELIRLFVAILTAQAWQHLGLRVKTGTDRIEKDLERAKVAIDCITFLIGRLGPYATDQEKNEMRKGLADLQINFARLSTEK